MRCLTLSLCLVLAPLLGAAVDLRGHGPATVTVRGNDGSFGALTSEVTVTATFDSSTSYYRPFGVRVDVEFRLPNADAKLSLDMDLRSAPNGVRTVHFPDPRQFELTYVETRTSNEGFGGYPYSGETRISWSTSPDGRVAFSLLLNAALFPSGHAGDTARWRDLTATVTFAEPLQGTTPAIFVALLGPAPATVDPEPDPTVLPHLNDTGCGGDSSSSSSASASEPSGCGGDGGSTSGCSGDGGAPDCNSGGGGGADCASGGGGGAGCSGGGGGVDCGVASARGRIIAPCSAGQRRLVHVRYVPYLAIFAMIYLLRRRLRARGAQPASPTVPGADTANAAV